ncbi:glycosyltransferase [Telmatobacter bradus]|uniref:glycosyltransferase n=1 Tax=Telmatobacter bradus TaxID=474953 RepID=UPI003B42940E
MLILHVIDTLNPDRGGPPEAVRQLIAAYANIGASTEIVCLDDPEASYLKNFTCPIHAMGQSYLGRYAFSPRLWHWMDENIERFDGIVMNGIWSFPGLALNRMARRRRRPYGVFVHGALDPWFNHKYPLKHLKKMLYWGVQYIVLRDALAVFFTTDTESRLAQQSFRPNLWSSVVVPYGINDPLLQWKDEEAQKEEFFRLHPRLRDRRYLLFLGRLHEKKGCDLLVDAFAQVADQDPELDLVMAGPDQADMQLRIKHLADRMGVMDRVHFTGMIRGAAKWGALQAAEALALPSHQENFGIAVVEALAVGKPVLISNQVNIWPDIKQDHVGLVEEDTSDGTRRLLRRWVEMSAIERARLTSGARSCFQRRYAMNRAAVAINDIFSPYEARRSKQENLVVSLHS